MSFFEILRAGLEFWPYNLAQDGLRYFMFAAPAFAIVWLWKGRAWEHRRTQSKSPRSQQLWMEVRYSLSTILIFSLVGTGVFLTKKAGLSAIYDDVDQYGLAFLLLSLPALILLHDAYFYWAHRFMHLKKVFRYVHAVHHRSTSPSPWAAYSFHPLEAFIQAAFYPVILSILPFHPFVLLGFVTYMIVRNVWGHLGYELLPRGWVHNPWLNWITTTTHHDLHHSTTHCNYGLYFTWWDRWMDTEHRQYRETFDRITGRSAPETATIPATSPLNPRIITEELDHV